MKLDKNILSQIESIRSELEDLRERLKKIENKKLKVVTDSVKGSSSTYPYIQHNCVIEGVEYPKNKHIRNKYRKLIKNKEYKLGKLKNELEYNLNYIEDSEIRQIIRYKYEDNMTWVQIMFKMKYDSEENARIKLKRFLERI